MFQNHSNYDSDGSDKHLSVGKQLISPMTNQVNSTKVF